MQSLPLEGKIIVSKILGISKVIYLPMIIKVPTQIIVELKKIQKGFIWWTKPKIKKETISSNFIDGGLKNVDINKKIASLQCSWIKRLYGDSFHK